MNIEKKYFGWLWVLKLFGKKWFGWSENTKPSPDAWRHFFDEGISPLDALRIDLAEGGETITDNLNT